MPLKMLLSAAAIGLMSTTAMARDIMFNEVDVTADLTVIEDAEAAAFWNTLETDLEARLLALLADHIAEDGARLVVNVESFAVEEPLAPFTIENAALSGRVHVVDLNNNANFESFELSVRIEGMTVQNADGADILAIELDPDAIYTTLVDNFAENIAERFQ